MKESYIEELAIHGGPESCAGVREGAGEVLTGVHAGRVIEPRNAFDWGADAVVDVGRQHRWRRYRESSGGPTGSESSLHACDLSMLRTGRSHDHPPVVMAGRVVRGRPRP
jgi:hypothetical protein